MMHQPITAPPKWAWRMKNQDADARSRRRKEIGQGGHKTHGIDPCPEETEHRSKEDSRLPNGWGIGSDSLVGTNERQGEEGGVWHGETGVGKSSGGCRNERPSRWLVEEERRNILRVERSDCEQKNV